MHGGPMPRLRVCFFNRSYYPEVASTGQLLTELAEDLVQHYDCDVTVLAGPALIRAAGEVAVRPHALVTEEVCNGVRVLRAWGTCFSRRTLLGRGINYLTYLLCSCLAARRVQAPQVVVSMTDPPVIGLVALLTAYRNRAKLLLWLQDIYPEASRVLLSKRNRTLDWILNRVSQMLVRKADCLVVLGDTMLERLVTRKRAHAAKIRVIPNWADCSVIVPGPKDNPFSAAHNLANAFVVMHSGNVGLAQGFDSLLDAAERWQEHPDIVLVIVGDGIANAGIQAKARARNLRNVIFLPYQPKEMLRHSYATADVFIISLRKGLSGFIVPSKLYGILASGHPYVAAVEDDCEVAVITRQRQCGLLARPEDGEDLARQVLTLYRDPELARQMGRNARQAALAFDRSVQVRAHANLFYELACGAPHYRHLDPAQLPHGSSLAS